MAWPADVKMVKVKGRYFTGDGAPAVGARVRFRPSRIVTDLNYHIQFGPSDPVSVTTNSDGYFEVRLRATDDTALYPLNWTWQVEEPNRTSPRLISVPIGQSEVWIDQLGDAEKITPAASTLTTALYDAPGGVARLDQAGLVPLKLLPASIGGTGGVNSDTPGGTAPDYVDTLDLSRALNAQQDAILANVGNTYATAVMFQQLNTALVQAQADIAVLRAASTIFTPAKLGLLVGWWDVSATSYDPNTLSVYSVPAAAGSGTALVAEASSAGVVSWNPDGFQFNSGLNGLDFTPGQVSGVWLHDSSVGQTPTFVASTVVKIPSTATITRDMDVLSRQGAFRTTIQADGTVRLRVSTTGASGSVQSGYGDWAIDVASTGVVVPGQVYVWTVVVDGANASLRINGFTAATAAFANAMASVSTPLTVGSLGGGLAPYAGTIGDVVQVAGTVSGSSLSQLEGFLANSAGLGWPTPTSGLGTADGDDGDDGTVTPPPAGDGHGDPNVTVSSATFQDDFGDNF